MNMSKARTAENVGTEALSGHTLGPWTVGTGRQSAKNHAICAGPQIIANVLGGGYPIGIGWSPYSEADAAFIVRACNAHDELVAVLTDLLDNAGPYIGRTPTANRARALLVKVQP